MNSYDLCERDPAPLPQTGDTPYCKSPVNCPKSRVLRISVSHCRVVQVNRDFFFLIIPGTMDFSILTIKGTSQFNGAL